MADRVCLRCDWTGDTAGHECPRCGAPLYRLGQPGASREEPARTRTPPAPGAPRPAGHARDDDEVLPPIAPAPSGRWPVIVLALILAAVGFGYALVRGSPPDPAEAVAPTNAGPEAATRSIECGGCPAGPPFGRAQRGQAVFASPPSEPVVTAPPLGPCGRGRESRIAAPAEVVPAPAADYRFRRTLGSEVGNAPDLVQAGRNAPAFVFDASIDRPVLSFSGRGGLALTPATGVVYLGTYSIELLFRLDQVEGYRKIVDFKDGSKDDGLYVQDGCLTFFPETLRPTTAITLNAYTHVVLTRDSGEQVVGYVDGVEQFAFDDADGFGEIATDTLRFFVDDAETRREYAAGAVTRIRLYDRALTAGEVAALACSTEEVPLSTVGCPD